MKTGKPGGETLQASKWEEAKGGDLFCNLEGISCPQMSAADRWLEREGCELQIRLSAEVFSELVRTT